MVIELIFYSYNQVFNGNSKFLKALIQLRALLTNYLPKNFSQLVFLVETFKTIDDYQER